VAAKPTPQALTWRHRKGSMNLRIRRVLAGDRLDIFVANAGISKAARIGDYAVTDFDNLIATNVRAAPFFLIQ
jgi:NAD(P)-dependent dehydrogenase (short-subunit alcohol dehydrogenase family)